MEGLCLGHDTKLAYKSTKGAMNTDEIKEGDDNIDEDADEDLKDNKAEVELPGLKVTDFAVKYVGYSHDGSGVVGWGIF